MMKRKADLIEAGVLTPERIDSIKETLPARYQEAEIDNVDERIQAWLYGSHKDGKGLYLYGPVGTGKTYAAYAIVKAIRENSMRVKIGNSAAILQDIKDDFKASSSRDTYYHSKFDEWVEYSGVMVIDDFGAEKPTEWVLETFYTMINTRYENLRPTIFTSNFEIKEIAERLGDRIASRITEMTEKMELGGRDRRV